MKLCAGCVRARLVGLTAGNHERSVPKRDADVRREAVLGQGAVPLRHSPICEAQQWKNAREIRFAAVKPITRQQPRILARVQRAAQRRERKVIPGIAHCLPRIASDVAGVTEGISEVAARTHFFFDTLTRSRCLFP